MLRFDTTFTYWIFAWYLLYIFGLVKYNPKPALVVGIIVNLWILAVAIYKRINMLDIFLFVVMLFLIKIIPLWTIRNIPFQRKDIYATLVLFIIYEFWIILNGYSIADQYKWYTKFKDGQMSTPVISFVHKYVLRDR